MNARRYDSWLVSQYPSFAQRPLPLAGKGLMHMMPALPTHAPVLPAITSFASQHQQHDRPPATGQGPKNGPALRNSWITAAFVRFTAACFQSLARGSAQQLFKQRLHFGRLVFARERMPQAAVAIIEEQRRHFAGPVGVDRIDHRVMVALRIE